MADRSKIEWTDASWNPIRARNLATGKVGWHCEHLSPGCANCYSEGFNARLGTGLPFKPGHRADVEIFLDETMLLQPLRWARPRMIFVCSMTDLFADFVSYEVIDQLFAVAAASPQHTLQILTKRSERMRRYMSDPGLPQRVARAWCTVGRNLPESHIGWSTRCWDAQGTESTPRAWPLPNIWLGVSAEDQRRADERVPDLLGTPAAVRFVSAEPLLGPVDLTKIRPDMTMRVNALTGAAEHLLGFRDRAARLDWIIVGGESGHGARPMHPKWARDIRDQCAEAGVPFFFKQWGEWLPAGQEPSYTATGDLNSVAAVGGSFFRVGKKAAGRLLDGVEHNGIPQATSMGASA